MGWQKGKGGVERNTIRQRGKDVESRQAQLRRAEDLKEERVGWTDDLRGECQR